MNPLSRKALLGELASLRELREPWNKRCRDLTKYMFPFSGRYQADEVNRGDQSFGAIIDATATRAARVLTANFMSYANSSARPWFALTLGDPDLAKQHRVRLWLEDVTRRMHRVIHKSNTYGTLHKMYDELGVFGGAVSIVLPDFENVIHHYPVTNGQFYLADDSRGAINTFYREYSMTVMQLVETFGINAVSEPVREAYRNQSNLHARHTVVHVIKPRPASERAPGRRDNPNKPWASIYFELAATEDKVLRNSGFDYFPVLAPRWDTTGGDVYGNSPGMEALPSVRQLQHEQRVKGEALNKNVDPPLQGPTSLKSRDVESFAGGFTAVDTAAPGGGVRPIYDIKFALDHLLLDIQDVRQQIERAFYADIFLMISGMNDTQKTAAEVALRQEEKMLTIGPVTARLYRELHSPLIDILFEQMLRNGALPPIPDELSGATLDVEYVSVLAQAQKAIGANSLDRFRFTIGELYAIQPAVMDKVDTDGLVDAYADHLGIPASVLVPGDRVALVRDARARAQAAADQAEALKTMAGAAKDLGATPVGGSQPNAFDLLNQTTGYNSPSPLQVVN